MFMITSGRQARTQQLIITYSSLGMSRRHLDSKIANHIGTLNFVKDRNSTRLVGLVSISKTISPIATLCSLRSLLELPSSYLDTSG